MSISISRFLSYVWLGYPIRIVSACLHHHIHFNRFHFAYLSVRGISFVRFPLSPRLLCHALLIRLFLFLLYQIPLLASTPYIDARFLYLDTGRRFAANMGVVSRWFFFLFLARYLGFAISLSTCFGC
jgi:hypothetical protein